MTTIPPKDPSAALRPIFRNWWRDLNDVDHDGRNKNRAAMARLRRLGLDADDRPDVIGALGEAEFRVLCRRIEPVCPLKQLQDERVEDLVIAAVALAGISENAPKVTTAELLGGADDERRLMKEGRFRALMRARTTGELFDQARRLPPLLKGRAPVGELGASLFLWRTSPSVRRNWARSYYHLDLIGLSNRDGTETPESAETGA